MKILEKIAEHYAELEDFNLEGCTDLQLHDSAEQCELIATNIQVLKDLLVAEIKRRYRVRGLNDPPTFRAAT